MTLGKEKIIPILAMVVLFVGIAATIYVNANENQETINEKEIIINEQIYSFEDLSKIFQNITIITDDGEKTGLPLNDIIVYSGVTCPNCNRYIFRANDPYQQTILWNDVKTGVLTYDEKYNLRVYFPNLAHTFWVYNLVEIEVNKL